jgi:hypothetical protein
MTECSEKPRSYLLTQKPDLSLISADHNLTNAHRTCGKWLKSLLLPKHPSSDLPEVMGIAGIVCGVEQKLGA